MQTNECTRLETYVDTYHGYQIHTDEIGAIAYMNGQPAARSTTVELLKGVLDVIHQEEQRHMEEYK